MTIHVISAKCVFLAFCLVLILIIFRQIKRHTDVYTLQQYYCSQFYGYNKILVHQYLRQLVLKDRTTHRV